MKTDGNAESHAKQNTKSQYVAMGHGPRATKTDGNAESRARTKKEPLVRQMATPNIIAKESPDMHWMGYGLMASKMDGDVEGHAG